MADEPALGTRRRGAVLVVVSLKMYFDPARTLEWARSVVEMAGTHPAVLDGDVELVVLPSTPALAPVAEIVGDGPVRLGAQDLFHQDRGPFTGGISGADLRAIGCVYAEVGHAERRRWFAEDDETCRLKLAAARRNGLTPILCVGEHAEGTVDEAVAECLAQLRMRLPEHPVDARAGGAGDLVVAYEPEWSIGASAAASPDHVREVTARIAEHLAAVPSVETSRVIYGGSAGPGVLPRLRGAVDGLFLGRFAHDPRALRSVLDDVGVAEAPEHGA